MSSWLGWIFPFIFAASKFANRRDVWRPSPIGCRIQVRVGDVLDFQFNLIQIPELSLIDLNLDWICIELVYTFKSVQLFTDWVLRNRLEKLLILS